MFVLLLVVLPLLEVIAAFTVADVVGWPAVLLWVLGAAVAGALVIRGVGLSVWRRVRRVLQQERLPGDEAVDGLLVLLGGLLLFVPGLVSDAVALPLLFPPTRAGLRRTAIRRWHRAGGRAVVDVDVVTDDRPVSRRRIGR